MGVRRDCLTGALVLVAALLACKSKDKSATPAASATSKATTVTTSATTKADPSNASMNKGTKPLKLGKLLGEATPEDFKKALQDDGWFVYSTSTSKSQGSRIVTIAGRKNHGKVTCIVTVHEEADPKYRAKEMERMKKDTERQTYIDGDYAMQVKVEKDDKVDEAASKKLMSVLVGS